MKISGGTKVDNITIIIPDPIGDSEIKWFGSSTGCSRYADGIY